VKAKLSIVPFEIEHLWQIQPREFEAREMQALGREACAWQAQEYLKRGPAWTGIIDGEILACGGAFQLWPGVAEIWAVTTARVTRWPLAFHRAIRRRLRELEENLGLWRLQVAIPAEHRVSVNWIRRLGFKDEGEKPHYGPRGETYLGFYRLNRRYLPAQQISEDQSFRKPLASMHLSKISWRCDCWRNWKPS
jgi:hypothetical protein